jgi:hypothetical protein
MHAALPFRLKPEKGMPVVVVEKHRFPVLAAVHGMKQASSGQGSRRGMRDIVEVPN